jgi:hypothetical protein
MVMSKRPPLDEWLSLFQATIAAEGITTAPGAVTGDSIIDAGLAGVGANSFVSMLMVLYPGQPQLVDSQDITAFNNATGEVTLAGAYKGVAAAIPTGVPYKIVTFRFVPAEVAALRAVVDALVTRLAGLEVAGTHAHANNLNWQNVVTITTDLRHKVYAVWLDFVNLTQNMNMRMQYEVDGATARTFWQDTWLTTEDDGVLINIPRGIAHDLTLDLQSAVLEGAARDIPYQVIYEEME